MKRFLLVGNGPYGNRGCEAIMRGTATILRHKFGADSEFVNACFASNDVMRAQAEVESDPAITNLSLVRSKWSKQAWYQRINRRLGINLYAPNPVVSKYAGKSCVAMEVGGDNYSLPWTGASIFFTRHIDLDREITRTGTPVVIWGASIGPFTANPDVENLMRDHLRSLSLILVRETGTQSYLASIGVEENVRLVADPAFAMEPTEPKLSDELRAFIDQRPVGLNLSPLLAKYRDGADTNWTEAAAECVKACLATDFGPILLLPHVTVAGSDDYQFMQDVLRLLPDCSERLTIAPPTLSAAEYKWIIARLRAIVAARTHATVAGFSMGVPTLSIGYSAKARGINQDIYGHTDWCIPSDQLSAAVLVEKIKSLLANEEDLRAHLAATSATMRALAFTAADHLAKVVTS